jgi:hypothetical protein
MQAGLKNIMFSGNGLFLVRLQGPGRVLLHSMPFERTVEEILSRLPRMGGGIGLGGGGGSRGGDGKDDTGDSAGAADDTDLSAPAEEEED